jgi:hypothetical protein
LKRIATGRAADAEPQIRRALYFPGLMLLDLTNLSEDQLIELNRRIVERLQLLRSAKNLAQLAQFSVGNGRRIRYKRRAEDHRTRCAAKSADCYWGRRIRTVAGQPVAPPNRSDTARQDAIVAHRGTPTASGLASKKLSAGTEAVGAGF